MSGPLPRGVRAFAAPLSWFYGVGVRLRNARFDSGSGVRRLPVPVISVGNVTAGGTGKTPVVAWLAKALRQRGHRPLIAMRGYRAEPGERGDEELEYARLLPDVPVVAHPKRHDAVMRFLEAKPGAARSVGDVDAIDCVLLDDGFQHRQLHRELDLVLVDAQRPALTGGLLPLGWLREPVRGLRRASAVIVTRTLPEQREQLARLIRRWHGRVPVAWTQHVWRGLDRSTGGAIDRVPVSWLRGKRVALFAGVGHPESVRRAVEAEGAVVANMLVAPDHVRVDAETLRRIREGADGADAILVTRKDWVKIEPRLSAATERESSIPWIIPDLGIEFVEGPGSGAAGDGGGEAALLALVRNRLAAPAVEAPSELRLLPESAAGSK